MIFPKSIKLNTAKTTLFDPINIWSDIASFKDILEYFKVIGIDQKHSFLQFPNGILSLNHFAEIMSRWDVYDDPESDTECAVCNNDNLKKGWTTCYICFYDRDDPVNKCNGCGNNVWKYQYYCFKCGLQKDSKQVKCYYCDKNFDSNHQYCHWCGNKNRDKKCYKCDEITNLQRCVWCSELYCQMHKGACWKCSDILHCEKCEQCGFMDSPKCPRHL